ncbi:DUF349 domain-containing protein [Fulvivirga sedimenti]|uniref:DUF349 domain-containing protein n=1 Tax=Fulvivirga sedimenti TaxID=2879465 RepID=A0A9X1KYG4_9BACT|nr:DUF349 domain-containing protein [Fulvivirga sedimenti]MCA6074770.1 DUF349 domain-containing protein [Fulvivirga sedimenti]MCA6075947.1 DUF349 domain-containing protein [Fulvivirga sedimenti]MCA6077075.1 DUF349 domain-containing protein [Fulvivirga sedimenti]
MAQDKDLEEKEVRAALDGADQTNGTPKSTTETEEKPLDEKPVPSEDTKAPIDKSDPVATTDSPETEEVVEESPVSEDKIEVTGDEAEQSEAETAEVTNEDITANEAEEDASKNEGQGAHQDEPSAGVVAEKPESSGDNEKTKTELESEHDLKEKDDDEDHEDEDIDYSVYSRKELVEVIKELAKADNVIQAEKKAREIKHFFDEFRAHERQEALDRFIAEGGEEGDFSYRPDELTLRFDANYQLIRDRKHDYTKNRERQKDENLKKKEDILERLREFVDSEETNISFDTFKKFQEEWKNVGPVPGSYARTMWANYNALIDRFYDNRSIYYELKELDRRKNLESKLELCDKAEALLDRNQISDAVKELNELHHEFKHIGPVPKDEQEPLWHRFKAASDAVYERRKEFVDKLKGELEANLAVKAALADEVEAFEKFDSDRIKAWNEKTKEILAIQKKWENTGGLPRAQAKEVNKKFWSAFKTFFSNKNHFFKKLDAEREANLEKKQAMVQQALALKDSEDFQDTAEKLKELQRQWREIGPVPGKFRESVYKEFKEACDAFFERKRASRDDASKEYVENLEKKKEICKKIQELAKGDGDHVEKFKKYQEEYNETGFVPKKDISKIRDMYTKAVDTYIKSLETLDEDQKEKLRIENEVSDILHSPNADQKLYRKEQSLRKQISSIENDIAVWKNNLEFFADSKKANKLKDEFQSKIDSAADELQHLKKQLRIIRTAG